jgi:hypothetical protein
MSNMAAFLLGAFSAYALSGLLVAAILMSRALRPSRPPSAGAAEERQNADLHSDMLWTKGSGQLAAVWNMSGNQQCGYSFHRLVDWSVAKTVDFNDDAYTDILWHHDDSSVSISGIAKGQQAGHHLLANVGDDRRSR